MSDIITHKPFFRPAELRISNLGCVELIELIFEADDHMVVITGDNTAGKSTILDSFRWIITGEGLTVPLRKGTKKGEGNLVLSDGRSFTVRRTVTESGGGTLTITADDGSKMPSPQKWLDSLVGDLAFDPLVFAGMKPDKQSEIIRNLCGMDFSELDSEAKIRYDRRTELNRELKQAQAVLNQIPRPAEGCPTEEKAVADVVAKRDAMLARVKESDDATAQLAFATDAVVGHEQDIQRLKLLLDKAHETLQNVQHNASMLADTAKALEAKRPTTTELEAVAVELSGIDAHNKAVRNKAEYEAKAEVTKLVQGKVTAITERLEAIQTLKDERTKAASLPVEGMAVTDAGVTINGELFGQLSYAERVRASAQVAMAMNPALPICLVREGANLNRANQAIIAQMAKDRGVMVLFEKFSEEINSEGLHIVEGAVAYVHGEPVAPVSKLEPLPEQETMKPANPGELAL